MATNITFHIGENCTDSTLRTVQTQVVKNSVDAEKSVCRLRDTYMTRGKEKAKYILLLKENEKKKEK